MATKKLPKTSNNDTSQEITENVNDQSVDRDPVVPASIPPELAGHRADMTPDDKGQVPNFKVGNGATYKGAKGHIRSVAGFDEKTGDPETAVFVPHNGEGGIESVDFADLENVVRS